LAKCKLKYIDRQYNFVAWSTLGIHLQGSTYKCEIISRPSNLVWWCIMMPSSDICEKTRLVKNVSYTTLLLLPKHNCAILRLPRRNAFFCCPFMKIFVFTNQMMKPMHCKSCEKMSIFLFWAFPSLIKKMTEERPPFFQIEVA
jgi:hypothetical protein